MIWHDFRRYKFFIINKTMKKNLTNAPDPMEKSMQGTSQFVSFEASMQQSMCGNSEKIPIPNASIVNRVQRQRDLQAYKKIKQEKTKPIKEDDGEEQNEFLNVGKWNKSKESSYSRQTKPQTKQKEVVSNQRKDKQSANNEPLPSSTSSKWEKKKITANRSEQAQPVDYRVPKDKSFIIQTKQSIVKQKSEKPEQIYGGKSKVSEPAQQQQQQEDQEQSEQDEEDEEQQQQQQEQEQEEEEQEQEEQQQDEEQQYDENQQIEEEEQLQQQEEQPQNPFEVGNSNQQFEGSSDAFRTQSVNTSALNHSPQTSKWNKKKAPLETMTKYETKKVQEGDKKPYHSRLNSANIQQKVEDQILQDIAPENLEEWTKVEKVLLRLKLLLS